MWRGLSGTNPGGRFAPGRFCSLPKVFHQITSGEEFYTPPPLPLFFGQAGFVRVTLTLYNLCHVRKDKTDQWKDVPEKTTKGAAVRTCIPETGSTKAQAQTIQTIAWRGFYESQNWAQDFPGSHPEHDPCKGKLTCTLLFSKLVSPKVTLTLLNSVRINSSLV